ncbi:sensor histidine kinase [Streptomyces sp. NBC_00859]|uniref:sensor histidine kinase n=1 Tax=Streptomyces sp. NBC_00859 TaxID=2903682 RepID=UPI00386C080E|nr:sensor histidine kinase [Streptomyces sp. NBC_00859]
MATPRHTLLRQVPAGVWAGAVWCIAALYPIIWHSQGRADQSGSEREVMDNGWSQLSLSLSLVLALTACALLTRRPWAGLAILLFGTGVFALAWRQCELSPLQFLAVDVAVGHLAATRSRRASLPFAGVALAVLAAFLTVRLAGGAESGTPSEPYVAVTVVVAWLIGHSVHQSRSYAEELRAQFAVQIAARAVAAERLRIARELHDMVAHKIGIVALQAGAAARVLGTQPESARQAMLAVESAGRDTLAGLRRMLVALRETPDEHGHDGNGRMGPLLAPASGLTDIERLAAETTAAGVNVTVQWRGEQRPLPPEIDLSAFRIIQESVTNVVRHAHTDTCEVSVDYRARDLAITVTDQGSGTGNTQGTGFGLTGMRERVTLLHGEFSALPRPEGGFRVTARLPIPPALAPSRPQPAPTGAR